MNTLAIMVPTLTLEYDRRMLRTSCLLDVDATLKGYLDKVQVAYEIFKNYDINYDVLGVIHDDLTIHEDGWEKRVLAEFEDENVVVAGFGGARGVGHPDIYKVPYHFTQLARYGFISNMTDAEKHGERVTEPTDVAFLDSMALFIRRSFLASLGGWPVDRYAPSHMSDLWICLQALSHGKRVRMVPISITHTGGGAGPTYPEWCKSTKWGSDEAMHMHNSRQIYAEFRGLLPIRIGGE